MATSSDGAIFAGTGLNGVYRTTDHGAHWSPVNTGLYYSQPYQQISALCADNNGNIYCSYVYTISGYSIIYFASSTDDGDQWYANYAMEGSNVNSLLVAKNGYVYMATGDGLYRSTDYGNTWALINQTDFIKIVETSNGILLGSTINTLQQSSDNGVTWIQASPYTLTRGFFVAQNGDIFQSTRTNNYRTTNNGSSWDTISLKLPFTIFGEANNDIVASQYGSAPERTTDYGDTWNIIQIDTNSPGVYAITTDSAGNLFAGTSINICYRSSDGGKTWQPAGNGLFQPLLPANITTLTLDNTGAIYATEFDTVGAAGYTTLYKSSDNAVTWTKLTDFANNPIQAVTIGSAGTIFLGTRDSGVILSTNSGKTWSPSDSGLAPINILSLFIDSQGNVYAGTGTGGVYRSSNNGQVWTAANAGLAISDSLPSVYAFTQTSGALFAQTNVAIFRSINNGMQWERTYFTGGTTIVSDGVSNIYAGGSGYLNRSSDGGSTWTALPIILESQNSGEQVIALARDWRGYLYASVNNSVNAVYRSLDSGKTWAWISDSITDQDFALAAGNRYMFAGTAGGVYRADSNAVVTWQAPTAAIRTLDQGSINHVSNLEFWQENYGPMFYNLSITSNTGEGMYWPRGSNFNYCFGGGFWFGTINNSVPQVLVGYDPNSGRSWFEPGSVQSALNIYDSTSAAGSPRYPESIDFPYDQEFTILYSTSYNRTTGIPLDTAAHLPPWPIWDTNPDTNAIPGLNHYWGDYVDNVSQRNLASYPARSITKYVSVYDSVQKKYVTQPVVYQKGGPVFISDEDMFTICNDVDTAQYYGPESTGYPQIESQRIIYSWATGPAQNMICIVMKIVNKSNTALDSCWLAPIMDFDIGNPDSNDCGFYSIDSTLNLGLGWSSQQNGVPYANQALAYPGVEGWDFLQSPAIYKSGDTLVDSNGVPTTQIAPDSLVGSVKPGVYPTSQQLGLVSFYRWPLTADPATDDARYTVMAKSQRDTSPNGADWADWRILMSTGPFTLMPKQTAQVVIGFMIARDSEIGDNNLQASIDSCVRLARQMQTFYDNGFTKIPPVPTGIATSRYANNVLPSSPLLSEYPNPMASGAHLTFTLTQTAPVTIRLYDMMGRQVKELAHEQVMAIGEHTIAFDASDLPNGAYQCVLSAPFGSVQKMVFLTR